MQFVRRSRYPAPVDRKRVAEDWSAQGYSCGLFVDPEGQQWNDFVHSTDELVLAVEGNVRIIMGGQSWDLDPGDEVFIPRRMVHCVHNPGPGNSRWLYGYSSA